MKEDESIYFLCADMGLGLIEQLKKDYPLRVNNVGIGEANMVSVAAGLCNVGFRPYCYTISNFLVERALEQIRNDICLHEYPVVLVGTSTGFDNGILGPTHHVIDEIGVIKGLPHMEIYDPATPSAANVIFNHLKDSLKPAYLRVGKGSWESEKFVFTSLNQMVFDRKESELLVISHGNIYQNIFNALYDNKYASFFCMNKVHPVCHNEIKELFERFPKILIIEDQMVDSGLYNTLCQVLVETQVKNCQLYSHCTPNEYSPDVGDSEYFSEKYGFTIEKIDLIVKKILNKEDYGT